MLSPFQCVKCLLLFCCMASINATMKGGNITNDPVINIPGFGLIAGIVSQRYPDVDVFYNIPFALPPVGDLRWKKPAPHGPMKKSRNCKTPGPICLQPGKMLGTFDKHDLNRPYMANMPMSEDCLTLNIATSRNMINRGSTNARPVMVWLHGGGFSVGSGANYPLDALVSTAAHSVLAVTINYRLGVFGFLGSSALAARSGGQTGNYGIDDQRLALKWVNQHISAFGGDASSITIWGESAGGTSVIAHLVEPASYTGDGFGLYHRAIIQSGTSNSYVQLADAERAFQLVINATDCLNTSDPVRCLVKLDALSVAAAYPDITKGVMPGPVIDGIALPADAYELIKAGRFNKAAAIVIGHNREEFAAFLPGLLPTAQADTFTEEDFDAALRLAATVITKGAPLNVSSLARVKQLYNNNTFPFPPFGQRSFWWWAAAAAASDIEMNLGHCTVRRIARWIAAANPDTFAYVFEHATQRDYTDESRNGWDLRKTANMSMPGNIVCSHSMEIDYTFGDTKGVTPGDEAHLAWTMSQFWVQFAKFGKPPRAWPSYDADTDAMLHFDIIPSGGTRVQKRYLNAQCDFWDTARTG